jgi:hypothetical protein
MHDQRLDARGRQLHSGHRIALNASLRSKPGIVVTMWSGFRLSFKKS